MNITRKNLLFIGGYMALTWLLSAIKISFLVGTHATYFSLSHCIAPLTGLFIGSLGATIFFAAKTLFWSPSSFIIACHLPSLSAALYLAIINNNNYTMSPLKRLLLSSIPLMCMILFNLHPVGWQSAPYSLFWLIPIVSLFMQHNNLFIHMLGSTFTAHAVGSVLWLYAGLVPEPETWINLMPVVALERLLFATGMFLMYAIFIAIKRSINTIIHNRGRQISNYHLKETCEQTRGKQ
jgi:hypothetical protein